MAGRGPAPKDADKRVRRPEPSRGDWVELPEDPYRGPKPALPRVKGGLLEATKQAWTSWWRSPMAHMWSEVDWPLLRMAIAMLDDVTRRQNSRDTKGLTSLTKELRLILDALGLTEKGRRDLRWRLPSENTALQLAAVTELRSRQRPDPRSA